MKNNTGSERIFRAIADQAKGNVYIVGGWVRDLLLNRPSRDLDILVKKDPRGTAHRVSRALGGSCFTLDAEEGIYRIALKNDTELDTIDISRMHGDSIEEDLAARDLTVNSMALLLPSGAKISGTDVIDPFNGRKDIRRGRVRMIGAGAFIADPLRMFRAFRIAAEHGFSVDPATARAVRKNAPLIASVAPERVKDELFRILARGDSAGWIRQIDAAGLLDILFPEITRMKSHARKFYFHPKGLWQHACETLNGLEDILQKLPSIFPGRGEKIREHLSEPLSAGVTRASLLKLIALLHDAAKPECAKRVGKKMRFLGHEERGAMIAAASLKRLKMSNHEIHIARRLINAHMRPTTLSQANAVTDRAAFRFFRDAGEETPDLLILAMADWYSYRRLKTHKPKELKRQTGIVRALFERYYAEKEKPELPRLVNGNDIMKRLGLDPGPLVGKLLFAVNEAVAMGRISTKKEAFSLAKYELTQLQKRCKIKQVDTRA